MIKDFYTATEEIFWKIKLTTQSPLNIKSGDPGEKGEGAPLMTYTINGQEVPIIPGSSLKGILRSEVERILNSAEGWFACDPLDRKNNCGSGMEKLNLSGMSNGEIRKHLVIRRSKKDKGLCAACVIFGSTVMKASSRISDFIPGTDIPVEKRTGTAISRLNGSVQRGALFPILYIPKGHSFHGSILFRGDKTLLKFLAGALLTLSKGLITIGAYSSKGFGELKVTIEEEHYFSGFDSFEIKEVESTSKLLKSYIKGER